MIPLSPIPLLSKPIEEVALSDDCLCVTYARASGIDIPYEMDASDFKGNTHPQVGVLALFTYKNGIAHVARVTILHDDGFGIDQDGVNRCNNPTDFVLWSDPNLRGFWSPTSAVALLN